MVLYICLVCSFVWGAFLKVVGRRFARNNMLSHPTSKRVPVPSYGVYILLHFDRELVSGETSFEDSEKLLWADVLCIDADSIV
ncbi:hypothetical protein HZ326_14822 [Fusarium oxysporum f. sp. albedinis]|nr:hypothetical protein HZ326_14822 [Fusarium oxysporum f. sp. albedinis]